MPTDLTAKNGTCFNATDGKLRRATHTGELMTPCTINTFTLSDLAVFFREGELPPKVGNSVQLFTQRDHVHECLIALHQMATTSIAMTMFGYDDAELDTLIRSKLTDEHVYVQLSLDRRQAGGKTEKALLDRWDAAARANSVAIGNSAASTIAHMKAGVIDGRIVWDGSTNWSMDGEGAPGARAQNNSLIVFDSHAIAARYRAQLDIDHDVMLSQMARREGQPTEATHTAG